MAKVIWSDSITSDLAHIFDYLAKSSLSLDVAVWVCQEILTTVKERLARFPT